jgi:hypothetical protein
MTHQIFISHSAKDKKVVEYFVNKFADTGVKPVLMEYEKWSRESKPNWKWIKDEIQKSKILFLILTLNLVKTEYTQNWVAFEVGVASTNNLPVFVFKEEKVDFPVPYLTHCFDVPFSESDPASALQKDLGRRDFSEAFLNFIINSFMQSIIDQIIKDPAIELPTDNPTKSLCEKSCCSVSNTCTSKMQHSYVVFYFFLPSYQ